MNDEHESHRGRSVPGRRQSGGMHDTGTGAYNQPTGEWATPDEMPVDISAVQFDDAFIDALSRDVPVLARDDAPPAPSRAAPALPAPPPSADPADDSSTTDDAGESTDETTETEEGARV